MSDPMTLADQLAAQAMQATGHPAPAVTALMRGAASILQTDFGPEEAARLMVEMVTEAHRALAAMGSTARPTRH